MENDFYLHTRFLYFKEKVLRLEVARDVLVESYAGSDMSSIFTSIYSIFDLSMLNGLDT
jgi:hypothetical protein